MSFAAIEARVKARSRKSDPGRAALRAVAADKARAEANRKEAGIVIPLSEWLGHNNGPPITADTRYLEFCWREAHREVWKVSPEIAVRRARKAAALGISYRRYTLEILERGRYLSPDDLPLPSHPSTSSG